MFASDALSIRSRTLTYPKMKQFKTITSTYIPLPIENVDTDQIIPARFLKATTREGFGENLFADWRYDEAGNPKQEFILNDSTYQGEILVAGKNFGSGSSREHAAWAVADYGFRVVISSFFADIFQNNALNNGILPVVVSPDFLNKLFRASKENPKHTLTVNLEKQTVCLDSSGCTEVFAINPYKKQCLLQGMDDIDLLLLNQSKIETYEKVRPWSY